MPLVEQGGDDLCGGTVHEARGRQRVGREVPNFKRGAKPRGEAGGAVSGASLTFSTGRVLAISPQLPVTDCAQ